MHRLILAIASWIGILVFAARAENYPPPVDQPHPDFVLPTIQDGRPIALSGFRGKKVLLIQFASW